MNTIPTIFNPRLEKLKTSLIRDIMNVEHNGSYDRISLGLGELPFPMPRNAQVANEKALREGKSGYTPNAGLLELRKQVATEFSTQQNVSLTHENVIITAGSTGALFIAFETLLAPGDEVLIPSLHYPLYVNIPESIGAKIVEYNLQDDFAIDIDDLLSKISAKTKIVVINSPSNPTGHVQTAETLKELAERTAHKEQLFFLSDEVYSTCLYDVKHTSIATFSDRVIVADGLSKRASMTGKRLGWVIGPKSIVEQALKVQQYAYASAPTDSQYAALAVLSGECDADLLSFQKTLQHNRKIIKEALQDIDGISVTEPRGAFYCLINISKFGTSMEVATKLIENVNVVTVPGLAFGNAGDDYLRLSFAGSEDSMREGISRMKGVFGTWQ